MWFDISNKKCGLIYQISKNVVWYIKYKRLWFDISNIKKCGLICQISKNVVWYIRYQKMWF